MSKQLPTDQQIGLFADENLSASEIDLAWKATYLATQECKKNASTVESAPKQTNAASPLPQEWPDEKDDNLKEVKPLKLKKCTHTECDKGLHCFRLTKKLAATKKVGECRSCNSAPIDLERVRKRNLADVEHTLACLKQEWIRYEYWTREFDLRAIRYARRKGMQTLLNMVEGHIQKAIGKTVSQNRFDGQQTSWEGNPLHYAQHATATCCRKCLETWHDISVESEITAEQIAYLSCLVKRYLEERLSIHDIRPYPVKVSPMKFQDEATLSLDFESASDEANK